MVPKSMLKKQWLNWTNLISAGILLHFIMHQIFKKYQVFFVRCQLVKKRMTMHVFKMFSLQLQYNTLILSNTSQYLLGVAKTILLLYYVNLFLMLNFVVV